MRIKEERAGKLISAYLSYTPPYLPPPVCELVEGGVQAIFGPSDPVLGLHIHSICDALDIPHLETRPDLDLGGSANENAPDGDGPAIHVNALPRDTSTDAPLPPVASSFYYASDNNSIAPGNQQQQQQPMPPPRTHGERTRRRFAINLYPAQHLINAALLDVVQYLNWTRFAVVFEGNDGTQISTSITILCGQLIPFSLSPASTSLRSNQVQRLYATVAGRGHLLAPSGVPDVCECTGGH